MGFASSAKKAVKKAVSKPKASAPKATSKSVSKGIGGFAGAASKAVSKAVSKTTAKSAPGKVSSGVSKGIAGMASAAAKAASKAVSTKGKGGSITIGAGNRMVTIPTAKPKAKPRAPLSFVGGGAGGAGAGVGVGAGAGGAFNTGDSSYNALLEQFQTMIQNQIAEGNQINPALNIDDATIARFLEQAKRDVHPFYAQQIDTIKQDVINDAGLLSREYESKIAGGQAEFQQNLGTFREQQAGGGTAFSGGRAAQEFGQQAAQNRALTGLSDVYGDKFRTLGRTAEEQIGAGNVSYSLPSLQKRQASLAGAGGYGGAGSMQGYTKGAFQLGKIPMAETQTARGLQQQWLSEAYQRAAAGRSWQDLFH